MIQLKRNHALGHASSRGYTIDQTILIVAIIAILVTIIIISVGWSLLNKASGSKLASQLRQVEDASGQFYGEHRMWPHQAITTPNETNNMRALTGVGVGAWQNGVVTANVKNLVPGFNVSGTTVTHNFSNGGQIRLINNLPNTGNTSVPGTNQFLVVQFNRVPVAEAQSADLAIDGIADNLTGRLVYRDDNNAGTNSLLGGAGAAMSAPATTPTTGNVVVAYLANLVQ